MGMPLPGPKIIFDELLPESESDSEINLYFERIPFENQYFSLICNRNRNRESGGRGVKKIHFILI